MFNTRNNRRILNELKKMEECKSAHFFCRPLKENMFEWHFTLRGLKGSEFEGGLYHGKICLPDEYPFKAPDMVFMNKSGRFEIGKNICLSITSYHNESWTPAWNIITILEAVGAFFLADDTGIGHIKVDSNTRKQFAQQSRTYHCDTCGVNVQDVEKIMIENEALQLSQQKLADAQPAELKPTAALKNKL